MVVIQQNGEHNHGPYFAHASLSKLPHHNSVLLCRMTNLIEETTTLEISAQLTQVREEMKEDYSHSCEVERHTKIHIH